MMVHQNYGTIFYKRKNNVKSKKLYSTITCTYTKLGTFCTLKILFHIKKNMIILNRKAMSKLCLSYLIKTKYI